MTINREHFVAPGASCMVFTEECYWGHDVRAMLSFVPSCVEITCARCGTTLMMLPEQAYGAPWHELEQWL